MSKQESIPVTIVENPSLDKPTIPVKIVGGGGIDPIEEKDPVYQAEKDQLLKKGEAYKKDETYSKKGVDERLELKVNTADFGKYQEDQGTINKTNRGDIDTNAEAILQMTKDNLDRDNKITKLEQRPTVAAKAIATSKLIDDVTSDTNNLIFEGSSKFYANNNVFTIKDGAINNVETTDATNVIRITGSIQLVMAGLINDVTTVTISCDDDMHIISKVRQFTISSENAFAIPFEFIIPGNKETTNITVTFSGLNGLTSRKIMPSYITFEKLR